MDLNYVILVLFLFIFFIFVIILYKFFSSSESLEEAIQLHQQGKFEESIQLLEKMLEKDERDPNVNYYLGLNYEKKGDFSNAIMYYKRILKFGRYNQNINEILIRSHLANSYENIENYTEAKNEYLILTQIEPSNPENFYNVGKIFFKAKIYPNAIKFLKQAIQINPRHFYALTTLGKCFFIQRIFTEARNCFENALAINPKDPENLYYLSQTLRYLGEYTKAVEYLDVVERDQKLKPKALLLKGMIFLDMESFTQAINEFEKAMAQFNKGSNDDLLTHYLAASSYEKTKNITKAIEHWEYIFKIQKDYKDVADKLKQYSDFRTSDAIKDLLISSNLQFETHFRKILDKLKLKPLFISLDNDSTITATCVNVEHIPTMLQKNILVRLFRETNLISETQIREFHDKMKIENATKGIYLTVSDFHPSAINYCDTRPIELYNSNKLTKLLES